MGSILLIDSLASLREPLAKALTEAGHTVTVETDGLAGLDAARGAAFDVIALDLLTTGMHGFELVQKLRTGFSTLRTPLVAFTDKVYPSDQRQALALGAESVVERLLGPEPVVAAIEAALASVRIEFWGVRGSIPAPGPETARYGGNTPCVTVVHGRDTLILDAGSGIRRLGLVLQAESRGAPVRAALLVSHTHWDHIQGFPFFVPAYVPANTVEVYGPRSLSKPLEKVLRGQMDAEYFPVALGDMAADIRVHDIRAAEIKIGPFTVSHAYMNHPSVTLGYRIQVAGRAVVYATDTEPFSRLLDTARAGADPTARVALDARLVELARGADLYIADAQYTTPEYNGKVGWGHSASDDAVTIAVEAGARRLALFSHDPMQDDDAVDRKVGAAQVLGARLDPALDIFGAREGTTIRL